MDITVTRVFKDLWSDQKRINVLRGGSRSSKSFSLMQMVVIWLMTGKLGNYNVPKGNFSIVRKTFPSLRKTVLRDFEAYLHRNNFYQYIDHKKSVHEFHHRGRRVDFFSTDDSEKLKGQQASFVWMNEADSCDWDDFIQMVMRLEHCCFIDVNPSNSDSWVKQEIEDKRTLTHKDVKIMVSTYLDNPYLPDAMIKEIQMLKEIDPELYKIYTLGEWAKITGKIFPNWEIVNTLPYSDKTYFGLDFGWTDETALIEVRQLDNDLYLKEHIYKKEMPNSELIDYIKENVNGHKIAADSSAPRQIDELRKSNIRVKAAKKGPDSIMQGINLVRQHRIYVDAGSLNLIKELKNYKWKKDKDGEVIPNTPIDAFNHLCDSLRYAVSTYGKKRRFAIV